MSLAGLLVGSPRVDVLASAPLTCAVFMNVSVFCFFSWLRTGPVATALPPNISAPLVTSCGVSRCCNSCLIEKIKGQCTEASNRPLGGHGACPLLNQPASRNETHCRKETCKHSETSRSGTTWQSKEASNLWQSVCGRLGASECSQECVQVLVQF